MTREEKTQRSQDCSDNHRGDENGHFFKSQRSRFHCSHCGESISGQEARRRWFGKCNDAGHSTFCHKAGR